jgi:hypothetical protein
MPIQFPSNPTLNQTYVYNGTTWTWLGNLWSKAGAGVSSGGGGASVTVSNAAPSSPTTGALWIDSEYGDLNGYVGNSWITLGGGGGTPDFTQINTNIYTRGTISSNIPFYIARNIITSDFTVPAGFNAQTPGPVTVANNVVVTVPDGSTWTIV